MKDDAYGSNHREVLSPYQQAVKRVLDEIAELEPDAGDSVSEVCIFTRTAPIENAKQWRDIVRAAHELWSDRGYARKVHNHWQVSKPFRKVDVARLLNWQGKLPRSSANGFGQR